MIQKPLLLLLSFFCLTACKKSQSSASETERVAEKPLTHYKQEWIPTPWVTSRAREAGHAGGEGTQWPQAIEVAPSRPDDVYLGTDVGGVYRSRDGGKNWTPANIGLDPRGATDFAIDPHNPDRVLLVACNSLARPDHGIWLSEDRGDSWKSTVKLNYKGYRDFRDQVAFDPTSYDAKAKLTRRVYWSTPPDESGKSFFYQSNNGGMTWQRTKTDLPLGNSLVRVHPATGWLYVATQFGLFRSKDHAVNFENILAKSIGGIDITPDKGGGIFIVAENVLGVSHDGGDTFTSIAPSVFPKIPAGRSTSVALKVSPANPKHLLIDRDLGDWNWTRFVSHDGGKSWTKGSYQTPQWETFIAGNNRPAVFAWHPTDPQTAWTFGGDFVVRTNDGGLTWKWSNSGYSGLMVGNSFCFNATNPDILYVPSQDYDGAVTTDGGHTWNYVNLSGEAWGGFNYGGYAFSKDVIAVGNRLGWGGDSTLHLTRDGGKTRTKTGIKLSGIPVGFGHPKNPDIAYLYDHRTTDGGRTWKKMTDCGGVLTSNPATSELIGVHNNQIVSSSNDGTKWSTIAEIPGVKWLRDVAMDPKSGALFVVSDNEKLWQVDLKTGTNAEITSILPADQFGNRKAQTVAVDPTDPRIVYVGKAGNVYATDTSVVRSTDGGKTWESLTWNPRASVVKSGPDGGREANWLRVHPVNRHLYVGTNCFGLWRFPPPNSEIE